MPDIFMRAGAFIAIILLGFFLKQIGFFKQDDFSLLAKITIRITLPCAIITSFAGKTINPAMLSLTVLGFGCGLLYISIGYLRNLQGSRDAQAFEMLNLSGYNVGNFVLPFAQNFLGPLGVLSVSLFDTGNAVICLGGAYSLAAMVKDGTGFSAKRIVLALAKSVPFVCYLTILLMNLLSIQVPAFVLSFAGIGSSANSFLAMLMIGVGFKLNRNRTQLLTVLKLLSIRYGVALALSVFCYFLLPFAAEVRQALVILLCSPIATAVPGFTSELKGDVGLSSAMNSISIIISIVITVTFLSVIS